MSEINKDDAAKVFLFPGLYPRPVVVSFPRNIHATL